MTTEQITQWLQEPSTTMDTNAVKALINTYPYFLPGRYMEAAHQAKGQPYSPQSLQGAHAYMGNWLLFHQTMQLAQKEPQAPSPESPVTTSETIIPDIKLQEDVSTEPLIQPVYTEDYFLHQGIVVADNVPDELDHAGREPALKEDPKSLMVVMSFAEWLMHFRTKTQKEKDEDEDRKAVKTMWQREKLAAALEEEEDEIPENVFEMAVNSITREDGLASESLAEILNKQGKKEQAVEMYRKLSLRNPQKSAYFAQQIAKIQKSSDL